MAPMSTVKLGVPARAGTERVCTSLPLALPRPAPLSQR